MVTVYFSFIEERARRDLEELTSVGPRVSGSEQTDIITVNKFLEILTDIRINLNDKFSLEFEEQRPSGDFVIDHLSVYFQIANGVARLEPKDPSTRSNNSFVINCHFDRSASFMFSREIYLQLKHFNDLRTNLINFIHNFSTFLLFMIASQAHREPLM